MGVLLIWAALCGVAWQDQARWEPVWWGVLDESAIEMAAEEGEAPAEDETVTFTFPWLTLLLEWIRL